MCFPRDTCHEHSPKKIPLVLHHVCGAFHKPALFPMSFLPFHHGSSHFFHTDRVLCALSLDVELSSHSSSFTCLAHQNQQNPYRPPSTLPARSSLNPPRPWCLTVPGPILAFLQGVPKGLCLHYTCRLAHKERHLAHRRRLQASPQCGPKPR